NAGHSSSNSTPSSSSGRNRPANGRISALTSGDTSEAWLKRYKVNGASPRARPNCSHKNRLSLPRGRTRTRYTIQATAPDDSQNPGASTATGCQSTTTSAANARIREKLIVRVYSSAASATASMTSARRVGSASPASMVYATSPMNTARTDYV